MNCKRVAKHKLCKTAEDRPPDYFDRVTDCMIREDLYYVYVDVDGDCWRDLLMEYRGRSRGLGDTIAKVTKAVGITPCGGCEERQAALNRLVPYG